MNQTKEQSSTGSYLMELNVRVYGNVLLNGEVFEFGEQIPGHCEK